MIDYDDALRIFAMFLALGNIVAWLYLIRVDKRVWPAVCLPLVLFIHEFVFFLVASVSTSVPNTSLTIWANGVFVHSLLTWLASAIVMISLMRRAKINAA